jgi:hypothetical protein
MWNKAHCCLSNWTFCCLQSEIRLHFVSQRNTLRHQSFLNFAKSLKLGRSAKHAQETYVSSQLIGLAILDARAGNMYGARVAVLIVFAHSRPPLKRILIV